MCDRKGCPNDSTYFVPRVGNVCQECVDEFINNKMFRNVSAQNLDDSIIKELLDILMGLEKTPIKNEGILKAFFNQHKIERK